MLTDFLNLRTSDSWEGNDEKTFIPIIYGTNTITPIPYNALGTVFVLADHACQSVTQVVNDNFIIHNWQLVNSVDNTGHAVAFLKFSKPISGTLRATVIGKTLFNTADIIRDFAGINSNKILKALQGLFFNTQRYELSGVLNENISKRSAIDLIASNIGLMWNANATFFGYLFPNTPVVSKSFIPQQLQCESSIIDLYNALTIEFNYDYSLSKFKNSMTIINRDSIEKYGRKNEKHEAKWVKNSGDAYDVASRLLKYYSQPVWSGNAIFDIDALLQTGEWVTLSHKYLAINNVFVKSVIDNGLSISIAFEGVKDFNQTIEIESQSVLFEEELKVKIVSEGIERIATSNNQNSSAGNIKHEQSASAFIEYIGNDIAELTIVDDNNSPISGATASVDGGGKKSANAAGKVQFKIGNRGSQFSILIEATGYYATEFKGTW